MSDFVLFARPWPVNLFILGPPALYYLWWRQGHGTPAPTLGVAALFGVAFGFVEAAVVVYLRAAVGLLPGFEGSLGDIATLAPDVFAQEDLLADLPRSLITVELFREAATMVMLVTLALLAARTARSRWAVFLWTFAAWDIAYYGGLWATIRWPSSLLTPDVLFLIPVPWLSQVWFPILVSALFMAVVFLTREAQPSSPTVPPQPTQGIADG